MDIAAYSTGLGRLVTNLMSLEVMLRAHLARSVGAGFPAFFTLKAGDEVPLNPMTDYRSLGKLIDAYNASVSAGYRLAKDDIVGLRDAVAHGRTVSPEKGGLIQLVKFSPPHGKTVRVEFAATLDEAWFTRQIVFVCNEYEKVRAADAGCLS